jgi:hypothetical protein
MNIKKILLLSVIFASMVAGASASLGSPSEVTVNACSNFFDDCQGTEEVIVMEWTDNQFDSSSVTVSADEINSKLDTGQVEDSFNIRVTGSQSQAVYDIRDGGNEDLRTVDAITNQWRWCRYLPCTEYPDVPSEEERMNIYDEWADNNQDDLDGDGYAPYAGEQNTPTPLNDVLEARVYALRWGSKYANVGDISTDPREEMATTFEVGGVEKTLSNTDIGRGQTANFANQVKINFRGGLESGYNFPIMDDSLVVYNEQRFNGFRIVEKDAVQSEYTSYLGNVETLQNLRDWRDDGGTTEQAIEQGVKNKLQEVTQEYSQSELYDHEYEIEGGDLSDGQITVNGDQQYSYPSFQVWIKGDELQYNIPNAEPEIRSVSAPDEIKEGEPGTISVNVGNKESATGSGDFSVRVTESSQGFTWNGISKQVENIQPGESDTVDLSISYGEDSSQKRNDGSVTVEVQNLRDTTETVNREVSLTGVQSNNCEPGSYSVQYNEDETKTISQCGSDGQTKEEIATCGAEERVKTLEDGTKTCVEDSDDVEDQPEDDDPNDGSGQKKVWIPTQGGSRCISQVVDEATQLEPSFDSKKECENSLSGNVGCAIQIPSLNPAAYLNPTVEPEPTGIICGENKVYANVILTLLIGVIGVQAGRKIGGAIDPDDKDAPKTATLILASGLGVLGAVVGFLFISVAQAIGFILVAGLIYAMYKGIMIYTGAEGLKQLITG